MSSDLKIGVLLNFLFLVLFFFFHFFGLHWMKLRNGMLKIMGAFLKRRGKKEEKTQFLWKKEKIGKKKGPDGIRTRDLRFPIIAGLNPRSYETDALPLGHRATTHVDGWNQNN